MVFGSQDNRYRKKTPEVTAKPAWPGKSYSETKAKADSRTSFLAKSVALMVKDVKVPEKPSKPTKKIWSPTEKALKSGAVPVLTLDPRKPESTENPKMSVCRNGNKVGRKYVHGDFNKSAKKSKDAQTETDPVKARHVALCTPHSDLTGVNSGQNSKTSQNMEKSDI